MNITGVQIIGDTTSKLGKSSIHAFNPHNGEMLDGDFFEATAEEITQAVKLATEAYGSYKQVSGKKRAEFLRKIAENILGLGETLVQRAMSESGLPEARIVGERGRTVNQLNLFADLIEEGSWVEAVIDKAQPERAPVPKPDVRRMLMPIGPVVVFTASNFPLAFSTAGGDTASAFAAGNPVIVKGHESHPGTNELVARAIQKAVAECDLHPGLFSSLNGHGVTVGQALVQNPAIKAVGFTGSFRAGKALFDSAAKREEPIPVFAEMGSVNPVTILPGAIKEQGIHLAEKLAGSVTLGSGQFCTNPGLLITLKSAETEKFISELAEKIAAIATGPMLNEGIFKNYNQLKSALKETSGVTIKAEYGGETKAHLEAPAALATVSASDFIANPNLHEEVFGPLSLLVVAENQKELEQAVSVLSGQLTTAIMATSEELAANTALISALQERSGRVIFNDVPTGVEVCHAMQHGGPYPATTQPNSTSVGTAAIKRFVRPVAFQNFPDAQLPDALKEENPLGIVRMVDGAFIL